MTRKGLVKFIDWDDVVTPVEDPVSMFVPDMSLSVRDIIARFAYVDQNTLLSQAMSGFDGDDDDDWSGFDDLSTMDIAELQALNERATSLLNDYAAAKGDVSAPAKETPAAPADDLKADA